LYVDCDPTVFDIAIKEDKWTKAMDDEINSIEKNDTWKLCDLLKLHFRNKVRQICWCGQV